MALDLVDYEQKAHEAVKAFWGNREAARQKQIESGKADQGERAGVTAGKNMDGFLALVLDIVRANGLAHAQIHQKRAVLTLPGYFRPTKLWDLLVISQGRVDRRHRAEKPSWPSFGNNFNNRTEEAIGTAHDLWTAYREEAFGKQPRPFRWLADDGRGCPGIQIASQGCVTAFSCFRGIQRRVVPQTVRPAMSETGARTTLHDGRPHHVAAQCRRDW